MRYLLIVLALLTGCATTPNIYQAELQSYARYLDSEIAAGRMTYAQGEYLVVQKANQLRAQRDRDSALGLGTAAIGLQMMQPYTMGPAVSCVTYPQGFYTSIQCR